MRTFKATEKGLLLEYLFRVLADTKKTRVREFLRRGEVSVNGKFTTRYDFALAAGDEVAIRTGREAAPAPVSPKFGVGIVYEDGEIIVVNKPAGLLTISTEKVKNRTAFFSVNDYLNALETRRFRKRRDLPDKPFRKKQIFLVHRLDREVSGLLVFAKNEEVKHWLQRNWPDFRKKYFAVVEGVPQEEAGTIASFLRENKFLSVYSSRRPEGAKHSVTRYQVLRHSPHYSLLEVELETGRKHQIRVHLSESGHPVAGDERYGSRTDPAGRLALHAAHLTLTHPGTGQAMEFFSPMPGAFEDILKNDESKEGEREQGQEASKLKRFDGQKNKREK